jgi:PIN domain nuclease of toxin-antitoxin system
MRLLIDAHSLIWHADGDDRLPEMVSRAMEDPTNEILISAVTFWELSLKESLGKLTFRHGVETLHTAWIASGAAAMLPVEWPHISRASKLPWLHRDPFDRLLVAQASFERLHLVTCDHQIRQYPGVEFLPL